MSTTGVLEGNYVWKKRTETLVNSQHDQSFSIFHNITPIESRNFFASP